MQTETEHLLLRIRQDQEKEASLLRPAVLDSPVIVTAADLPEITARPMRQ